MSDVFTKIWAKTLGAEGGYSNDPADPGGETNHGITERVARAHGYTGKMIDLTIEESTQIAKKEYWDPLRLDAIAFCSEGVAAEVFDTAFNLGPHFAVTALQRAIRALNRNGADYPDIYVDGSIGNATGGVLAHYLQVRGERGEAVLIELLNAQQACEYLRQVEVTPTKEKFLFGWIVNRVLQLPG